MNRIDKNFTITVGNTSIQKLSFFRGDNIRFIFEFIAGDETGWQDSDVLSLRCYGYKQSNNQLLFGGEFYKTDDVWYAEFDSSETSLYYGQVAICIQLIGQDDTEILNAQLLATVYNSYCTTTYIPPSDITQGVFKAVYECQQYAEECKGYYESIAEELIDYYTKEEVDDIVSKIEQGELDNYYTKKETEDLIAECKSDTENYVDEKIADINVPTKTSQLTNDSDFVTSTEVDGKISSSLSGYATEDYVNNKISDIDIPTKTSELTNDSGFITSSSIPTKTSQLTNDSDFVTSTEVESLISNATSGLATNTELTQGLGEKVDKVDGKELSTNDFTDDYLADLENANDTIADISYTAGATLIPRANSIGKIDSGYLAIASDDEFEQGTSATIIPNVYQVHNALEAKQGIATDSTDTTSTAITLTPTANTNYSYSTLTSLTISSVPTSFDGINIYFTSGNAATTFTYPDSLGTIGEITINASKRYVIAIKNNIMILGELN